MATAMDDSRSKIRFPECPFSSFFDPQVVTLPRTSDVPKWNLNRCLFFTIQSVDCIIVRWAMIRLVGCKEWGVHNTVPLCNSDCFVCARLRAALSPDWTVLAEPPWDCNPLIFTLDWEGRISISSPGFIDPLRTVPVTTVPNPVLVKTRSTFIRKFSELELNFSSTANERISDFKDSTPSPVKLLIRVRDNESKPLSSNNS